MLLITGIIFTLILLMGVILREIKRKHADIWLPAYIRRTKRPSTTDKPTHILFCFADHFEPRWGQVTDFKIEQGRVDRWCHDYVELAKSHRDADGRYPQHTFFYPEEEYHIEHLNKLSDLCRAGFGEIEVHLHHHDDTADNFKSTLNRFAKTLYQQHGALTRHPETGQLNYGFIHGNWALDNSRRDGAYCGINNELTILRETGCYADFTLPSAPSDTQTAKINSIYYATDDPLRPKSHNTGVDVRVGGQASGDLMIIQGPLMLNWQSRKWGLIPRIENGDIRDNQLPSGDRVDNWVKSHIHVKGRPEWIFIKVHSHGTQESNLDILLGAPINNLFNYLEDNYNDGKNYCLHYVNAREMYNIAKAAEAAHDGNPNAYRDFILPPPANCQA